MSRFVFLNLADVPPPPIIDPLDFETLRTEILADGVARLAAVGIPYNVDTLESDPFVKLVEAYAFRELNLRARINDAVRAILLASSWAGNMDQVLALLGVKRQEGEEDDPFRLRGQLALEAFSTAGPRGAYEFYARTVLTNVRDASAVKTNPGTVQVTVLKEGDVQAPTQDEIIALTTFLNDEAVRPLTDIVYVTGPRLIDVEVSAVLTLHPGPAQNPIKSAATAALDDLLEKSRMLGTSLPRSAIIAKLQQPGVFSVNLISPEQDILLESNEVINVTSSDVSVAKNRAN